MLLGRLLWSSREAARHLSRVCVRKRSRGMRRRWKARVHALACFRPV